MFFYAVELIPKNHDFPIFDNFVLLIFFLFFLKFLALGTDNVSPKGQNSMGIVFSQKKKHFLKNLVQEKSVPAKVILLLYRIR